MTATARRAGDVRQLATRRVAFLRSIEIQQAAPYLDPLGAALAGYGVEARLFYTDGDVEARDWPGEAERMPPDISPEDVATRLLAWGADAVVSLSIPDENALRDALVAELLAAHGIPTAMHHVEATERLSNKWATKLAVLEEGLDTPPGLLMDGDLLNGRCLPVPAYTDMLTRHARRLGFPLLTKPLWDCLGNGIRFIGHEDDWEAFLAEPYEGNAVLERCLPGELCSVEIVGTDGDYFVQPVIWKGQTGDGPTFPFRQIRYAAPRSAADRDFAPVRERLVRLCGRLGVSGAVEVEMIYHDGGFSIIEINPRVSGSTGLSIAASGRNTYVCLLQIALGRWVKPPPSRSADPWRLAVQLPVALTLDPAMTRLLHESLPVERVSTFTVEGESYANMLLVCEGPSCSDVAADLRRLTEQHGLLAPDVLAQVSLLLARGGLPTTTPPLQLEHPTRPLTQELCTP